MVWRKSESCRRTCRASVSKRQKWLVLAEGEVVEFDIKS